MATRSTPSSLSRRFIWTIISVVLVATVSVVWIVVYQTTKNQLVQPDVAENNTRSPPLIDSPDDPPAPANEKPLHNPVVADAPHRNGPKPAGSFHSSRYGYAVSLDG